MAIPCDIRYALIPTQSTQSSLCAEKSEAHVTPTEYSDPESRPPVFKSAGHEIASILILTFATIMNTASSAVMQIAVPSLGRYFGITGSELSWSVSSFSLMSGATILLFSGMADKVGRKRLVVGAYAWFTIWSLAAAFTIHHIVFDVCRGMQGLAAAACPSAGVGILGSTYRNGRRKNRVMAVFNAGSPLGAFLGIMTGGVTIEYINWQSIFYWYAIVYAVLTVLAVFVVPGDSLNDNENLSIREFGRRLKELDLAGAVLSIVGCVMFVLAASQAGSASHGWATPYVLIILVASLVVLATFVWWESRTSNPLMPLKIWQARGFAMVMLTVLFSWMCFTGVLNFYVGLYFQNVIGASPMQSAIYFVPQTVTSAVTVNIIAATLHRAPGRLLLVLSQFCNLAASLLWSLMPIEVSYFAMALPAICLSVMGADLAFNVANMHTLSTVSAKEQSTAAGIFYTVDHLAGSLGVSLSSSVVSIILRNQMEAGVSVVTREGLASAYNGAFWFAVGCSCAAIVCSCFAKVGTCGGHSSDAELLFDGDVVGDVDVADVEETSSLLGGDAVVGYKSVA
ncbi:major facilitator superfamily-domain-containing protein [Lipomyces tetrasporus]|uniref:Major facilitator superfamily-domain-containing protein n=1 Tax=Lipomyces tetrasporus TaxID=54092 RepID=A0AAD7QK28_9ASCO|nr:major facilitator superfamily-domain-containing protein [Lipomyces tetrasporus]KAJ8096687.1 major facilitator superfamily-domain-containing protein [Lipomyces tetrasporus]